MVLHGQFRGIIKLPHTLAKEIHQHKVQVHIIKEIDIGAPEGTVLIAVADGEITYTGFLGGGGYTITLSIEDMKITYCHVSPTFIVEVGQKVERGEIIGYVGPKYVYGVKGNTYTDSTGKPTNGATTGCHLHLGIRVNGEYTNPLNYY